MTRCKLMKGDPGFCQWCGNTLPKRRRKWCSDACSEANWNNHDWNSARRATLTRDNYTCVRCGHIGWNHVPYWVLPIESTDPHLTPGPLTDQEDWAIAFGLLAATDATASALDREAAWRRQTALDQLPDSIVNLVAQEHRQLIVTWTQQRRRVAGHQLEVNHIDPRRNRGYRWGCWHHLEKLETLCHPCHVDETNRQRRNLPSWREDPRPLHEIRGQGVLL